MIDENVKYLFENRFEISGTKLKSDTRGMYSHLTVKVQATGQIVGLGQGSGTSDEQDSFVVRINHPNLDANGEPVGSTTCEVSQVGAQEDKKPSDLAGIVEKSFNIYYQKLAAGS